MVSSWAHPRFKCATTPSTLQLSWQGHFDLPTSPFVTVQDNLTHIYKLMVSRVIPSSHPMLLQHEAALLLEWDYLLIFKGGLLFHLAGRDPQTSWSWDGYVC